jgi:hypothetical protein
MCRAALCLLVFAVVAACANGGGQLSIEEGVKCARQSFNGHPGTFRPSASAITYSYETANGPARAIVTFDARRRPVGTFFENAPFGSHQELMEAANVIKDCVAYGPRARGDSEKRGTTSLIGK